MEDLFPALIFLVIGLISAASKKKKQSATTWTPTASAPKVEVPPSWKPAQPTVLPPSPAASTPEQPMAPTVHPHVAPDCDTHDAPGSLGVTSAEGKDPCHEEQLTHVRTADASATEAPGLTFDWSGENLVKAFVMQEVLTRPCQRQAR